MLLQMVGLFPLNILIHLKESIRTILKRYFSVVNSLTINEYCFFEATEILKFYNMKKYEFLNRFLNKFLTDGTCTCNSL